MNQRQARRAQVLAAAAEVFARTGITPVELAQLARMSREEIAAEVIAHNMEDALVALRQAEDADGALLDNLVDAVPAGVQRNLDPAPAAVQLELLAEATRNPKVAEALRAADARARERVRELLTGERGSLRHCRADELDSRIEALLALFGGMAIRSVINPALKREALIAAVQPVVRMLLTPP